MICSLPLERDVYSQFARATPNQCANNNRHRLTLKPGDLFERLLIAGQNPKSQSFRLAVHANLTAYEKGGTLS
jgi:hypothetical protein